MSDRYWQTGDDATDSNLNKLESALSWPRGSDGESVHQLLSLIIGIEKMLPKAVAKHFALPSPYVGNAHFEMGQSYRDDLVSKLGAAIEAGLSTAYADPALSREGGADYSDRPMSRGEVILAAISQYKKSRSTSDLARLQAAVGPTPFSHRVASIQKLSTRKKPIGNQSPELAILGELHRLEHEASHFHHVMA